MKTAEDKIKKFEEIQKQIARQYIYIPESHCGTIDPDSAGDHAQNGYVKVCADRFGPFSPLYYNQTRRIVFLVKEPYYSGELTGGYDGTDKVKDYGSCSWKELGDGGSIKIYQNIAQCAFQIITGRPMDRDSAKDQELAVRCLRENVCIINVNFFPLIAPPNNPSKASNNNLIYKWSLINKLLINEMLDICDPQIVIGGSTLTHFCDPTASSIFNQDVRIINTRTTQQALGKNGIIYCNNRVFINAYHPSCPRFLSQIPAIHKIISDWERGDLSHWEG